MTIFSPDRTSFDLPRAVSANVESYDWMYNFIWWFSMVFWVVITAVMIYFALRYKRKPGDARIATGHYPVLETAWTVLPVFFIIWLFHAGFSDYLKNAMAGDDAMEVRVTGQKWLWTFTYPNGRSEPNHLYLPIGKQVKFIISAQDVLHSFYLPDARIKKDAVPGMYTMLVFTPTVLGDTPVYCAEYCGAPDVNTPSALDGAPLGGHSSMMAWVHVVPQAEFDKMMAEGPKRPDGLTEPQWGAKLYRENACLTCHSVDGAKGTGPTWKGMFGQPAGLNAALSGGLDSALVDENYVRESILKPNAKVVAGFSPVMPPYTLSDKQIDALISYMKTLK